jgi:alkanesulfonate monooxygenase SsuD/methylene tetrahydromethanopterin reductase-like flavin-dependent oxidoreductase (luciferase family)
MVGYRIAYNLGTLLSMNDVLLCSKLADKKCNVDSIWIPESWGREAFTSLGALSQTTEQVKLGTSIISIYARTPATVAMAATTLDLLSNNRSIIGLGASTSAIVENWHGLKFQQPLARMREYLECLKPMIRAEKVNYKGKFFDVKNFKLLYKPQRQNIPIFVAAVNKKMISLATEIADGILLYLRPIDELRETVSLIKSKLCSDKKEFEIACVLIGAISNKYPQRARERAAKTLAFYISVGRYYSKFLSENGFKDEINYITANYRSEGLDAAAKFVSDKMLDSLTISGTGEDCIKSLQRFLSCGITLPIIQINPVDDAESSIRTMLSIF